MGFIYARRAPRIDWPGWWELGLAQLTGGWWVVGQKVGYALCGCRSGQGSLYDDEVLELLGYTADPRGWVSKTRNPFKVLDLLCV